MQATEHNFTGHLEVHVQRCIADCLNCYEAASACLGHCLGLGGEKASPAHIGLLMDCAEICRTSIDFMLRGSCLHNFTCGVCGKICEHCARKCEALDASDEHMRRCAAACRRCAESCQNIAAHHSPFKGENEGREELAN